jgi:predicted Zn-dependent protease
MTVTPAKPGTATIGLSWRWLAVLLATLAILGGGGFWAWQWSQDQKDREEALRLAEKGDFSRAEPLLLRQAKRYPTDPAFAKELALGYMHAGRPAEAEPYFETWCEANPKDAEPFVQRTAMWVKWNRLKNAVSDARHVLTLRPDNKELHQHLTRWLLSMGQLEESEQECKRFLERWPQDRRFGPWVLFIQAHVCQRTDRPNEAAAILDGLIRDFPDFVEAYIPRGTLYLEAGQPKEAVLLLRRAAAIPGPHRRDALNELAKGLYQLGQSQEAEQVMKEARLLQERDFLREMTSEFGATNASAQARLAEEMLIAGKTNDGLLLLNRLLEMDPNCAVAHRVLADYYDRQGQPERAAPHRPRPSSSP